jgi:hypothetical protein
MDILMYLVAKGLKFNWSSPKLDLIFYNFFITTAVRLTYTELLVC